MVFRRAGTVFLPPSRAVLSETGADGQMLGVDQAGTRDVGECGLTQVLYSFTFNQAQQNFISQWGCSAHGTLLSLSNGKEIKK